MGDPLPGRLDAEQGDEIGLAELGVLAARGLAQKLGFSFRIKDIVDDLIGQADVAAERQQGRPLGVRAAAP